MKTIQLSDDDINNLNRILEQHKSNLRNDKTAWQVLYPYEISLIDKKLEVVEKLIQLLK